MYVCVFVWTFVCVYLTTMSTREYYMHPALISAHFSMWQNNFMKNSLSLIDICVDIIYLSTWIVPIHQQRHLRIISKVLDVSYWSSVSASACILLRFCFEQTVFFSWSGQQQHKDLVCWSLDGPECIRSTCSRWAPQTPRFGQWNDLRCECVDCKFQCLTIFSLLRFEAIEAKL